ncbi:beta-N-acetylglucosaminidase domain-containing protein [uncultured Coprobacter sp.]|uniref:beta-N-acetylglucosaminidase domain-containing protein n=1 Tax=uncultured Coprobacter sp. TaxID=1720550 RepID=UPI0025948B7A|nr:beta-N-acetylglucosaminidase domain-containing protein [uncultured Coprobacter sp.]
MRNTSKILVFLFILSSSIYAQSYTIYPTPQRVTETPNSITLTDEINVICENGITSVIINRMKEVLKNAGYSISLSSEPSSSKSNLFLGIKGANNTIDEYIGTHNLPVSVFEQGENKFDPYLLQINDIHPHGDIVIVGNDEGSAYYAFATLEQMFEQSGNKTLRQITFEDYSHTQYRGIVEGFYGHPYSVDNRISLFEFCKRFKMNVFIYGPKSDPYHLGNWRDNYPTSLTEQQKFFGLITQDDLRRMVEAAKNCNVNFIWAAHPGLQQGISFSNTTEMNKGIDALMTKFEHLHTLGVRGFGVFIDDMSYTPSGNMQAHLANEVQIRLRNTYNNTSDTEEHVSPLFFVPTAYALNYGASSTLYDLKNVDSEVVIAFTGYDCFSNIRPSSITDMSNRVGRNPVMWWNNPVNDDHDDRIYMRKMTTHWTIEDPQGPINSLHGLVMNPMNQAQASKIALFGGADYGWNPSAFDVEQNWEDVFDRLAPNDSQTASALKCFARYSNTLVEDDDMIKLYDNFIEHFSSGQMPVETKQLQAKLEELNQACLIIETMKNSEKRDYRLMYEDIRCWNAKLKTITSIALDALDMLEKGNEMQRSEAWVKYLRLKSLYGGLSTDSAYLVSALEGYGTSTSEKYYEVKPAESHLRPFVDFLVEKLGNSVPGLWPSKDEIQIISCLNDLQGADINEETNTIYLSGLKNIKLEKDEYIGIYWGRLENISIDEQQLAEGLTVEYSENGKQWAQAILPLAQTKVAYVRIKNTSEKTLAIGTERFTVDRIISTSDAKASVTTNMATYQNYNINNVTDGNDESFFWKNGAQAIGDYILLTYPTALPQYKISITFCEGDQPTGTAAIEVSADNQSWHEVATFTAGNIDYNRTFTCNANGYNARYVRFSIKSIAGQNWLQVAEFKSETSEQLTQTSDNNGLQIAALADKDLSTCYQAVDAGYLEHRFIENISINSIEIYQDTEFDTAYDLPEISVYDGNEWIKKGNINSFCTIIDTQDLKNIIAIKIKWNRENIPNLYEILPFGEPYIELPETPVSTTKANINDMVIYHMDGYLHFSSDKVIKDIVLYNLDGKVLGQHRANSRYFDIPFRNNASFPMTIQVKLSDGKMITRKIMITR